MQSAGGGTTISIEYIVENSKNPVKGFKTVDRNPANYPDCDVMLVADIFSFKSIAEKLKKLQVSFPFYNAAEYIKSLPAGSSGGMQKLKDKVQSLAQELEGATEQINGLKSEVAELKVANAELAESNAKLAIKNKIRNARKRKK